MRRIRALTGPVVLTGLLATTPQLAFGQLEVEMECGGCRPGTEIPTDQFGEFLAKNLTFAFGTDTRPLSVTLRLETVSREKGVIGRWESESVRVAGGGEYRGSTLIVSPRVFPISALGLGEGRNIGVLGFGVWDGIEEMWTDRRCEGATHAVQTTIASNDGRMVHKSDVDWMCLDVGS